MLAKYVADDLLVGRSNDDAWTDGTSLRGSRVRFLVPIIFVHGVDHDLVLIIRAFSGRDSLDTRPGTKRRRAVL